MRWSAACKWVDQLRTDEFISCLQMFIRFVQMSYQHHADELISCVEMSWTALHPDEFICSVKMSWSAANEMISSVQTSWSASWKWVDQLSTDELISTVQMSWVYCTWFRRQHCYHHRRQLFRRAPGEQLNQIESERGTGQTVSVLRFKMVAGYVESPTLKRPSADTQAES